MREKEERSIRRGKTEGEEREGENGRKERKTGNRIMIIIKEEESMERETEQEKEK